MIVKFMVEVLLHFGCLQHRTVKSQQLLPRSNLTANKPYKTTAFMKYMAKLLAITLLLSACTKDPKPVSYYKQNESERKQMLEKFKDNPGKYQKDGDVINAVQAEQQIQTERFFKMEPPKKPSEGAGLFKLK